MSQPQNWYRMFQNPGETRQDRKFKVKPVSKSLDEKLGFFKQTIEENRRRERAVTPNRERKNQPRARSTDFGKRDIISSNGYCSKTRMILPNLANVRSTKMSPISQSMRTSGQNSRNAENELIVSTHEADDLRSGRHPEVRRNRIRRGCQKTFVITRKSNDGDIFDIEDILKPKNNAEILVEKEVVTPRCRSKSRERRISSAKLYNEAKQTNMQNSENLKIKKKKFDISSSVTEENNGKKRGASKSMLAESFKNSIKAQLAKLKQSRASLNLPKMKAR